LHLAILSHLLGPSAPSILIAALDGWLLNFVSLAGSIVLVNAPHALATCTEEALHAVQVDNT
jgi:hypothetical protein